MVKIPATQVGKNFSKNPFQVHGENWGMFAYMISSNASKLLVKHAFPIANQIDSYLLDVRSKLSLNIFRSRKDLVITDNSLSRKSDVQVFEADNSKGTVIPSTFQADPYGYNIFLHYRTSTSGLWTFCKFHKKLHIRSLTLNTKHNHKTSKYIY
jgi:hypothetical protein